MRKSNKEMGSALVSQATALPAIVGSSLREFKLSRAELLAPDFARGNELRALWSKAHRQAGYNMLVEAKAAFAATSQRTTNCPDVQLPKLPILESA